MIKGWAFLSFLFQVSPAVLFGLVFASHRDKHKPKHGVSISQASHWSDSHSLEQDLYIFIFSQNIFSPISIALEWKIPNLR